MFKLLVETCLNYVQNIEREKKKIVEGIEDRVTLHNSRKTRVIIS